jgi:HAD superfamily hydrolase (TIGR01509 family)
VNRFDPLLFSCVLGEVKPSPPAFAGALTRLRREPDEVLVIDDSPAVIDGARAAGLHAIHFTSVGALAQELRAYMPIER